MVIHDRTARRTTGVNRRINALTLDEVNALDAGWWKGAQWAGAGIPTLDEVLVTVPHGKRLFIEIKCGSEVLTELQRVLDTAGKSTEPSVIIGFDYDMLRRARERFPQLPICWNSSPARWKYDRRPPDELISKAIAANFTGLGLDRQFHIDEPFVSRAKDAGLKSFVWTVDDAKRARALAALGIDGIMTNRPLWLREQLE